MVKIKTTIFWSVLGFATSFAQVIDLSGNVIDENGEPIGGVVAELLSAGMRDTTDVNGLFHLQGDLVSIPLDQSRINNPPLIKNNRIQFTLDKKTNVSITAFDIEGKVLKLIDNKTLAAGIHHQPLEAIGSTPVNSKHNLLIVRINIGESNYLFKTLNLPGYSLPAVNYFSREFNGLSKRKVFFDTLNFSKAGRATRMLVLTQSVLELPDLVLLPACVTRIITPDTTTYAVLVLKAPLGCETFYLGDSVTLSWEYYQVTYGRVGVQYSLDGGNSYEFVWNRALNQAQAARDTVWVIPDSARYLTDNAVIRIYDYEGGFGEQSNPFYIKQR